MYISIDLFFTHRIDKLNEKYDKTKNTRSTKKRVR